MPDGWRDPEAGGEAGKKLGGEGDFGQQYQGLAALAEDGRDGFHINFGLARAGDPFEQGDGKHSCRHGLAKLGRGYGLC